MKILALLFLSALAFGQLPPTPNLGLTNPSPHAQYAADWYTNFAKIDAGVLLKNPFSDQTITGAHQLVFSDPGASIWLKTTASTGGLAIGSVPPGNDGFSGNDLIIQDQWTGAVPGNQFYSILMNSVYAPASPQAASIWGTFNDVSSSNNANANGTSLIGYESHVIANSPGSVGSVQAAVYSAGVGASGGSPSFIFGLQVHAINSGTGTSPTNQAIKVTSTGAGGASSVVTDNRSIEIDSPVVTGTLTHNYGIYIQDQGLGGANNPDPHGIFEEGTTPNDLGGGVTEMGLLQEPLSTPANSSAACTAGQMWADTGFVYVCTATNTIKRSALSSF